jgi:replicative DNA helicase
MNPEVAVLGAILLTNGACLDDLTLTPDDFASARFARAFGVLSKMRSQGDGVDVITFSNKCPEFITESHQWVTETPTASNVNYYAKLVSEAATRRRMALAGTLILEAAQEQEISHLAEFSRKTVDDALGKQISSVKFLSDEIDATIDSLGHKAKVYSSGWSKLDECIGGFRPGALYLVAARPAVGKTVIGLQLAVHMAKFGAVAFSSLEMSREELHKRIIAQVAEVPMGELTAHELSTISDQSLARKIAGIRLPISIDDRSGVTVQEIRTHARSVNRIQPLSAVVVDYLGLIADRSGKERSKYEVVTEISQQLKILARTLKVPVIALAQLNRAVEGRKDGKPILSDLRDSGSLEQDADVVILLSRDVNGVSKKKEITLDVAKNRHGATGLVHLEFQGEFARAI